MCLDERAQKGQQVPSAGSPDSFADSNAGQQKLGPPSFEGTALAHRDLPIFSATCLGSVTVSPIIHITVNIKILDLLNFVCKVIFVHLLSRQLDSLLVDAKPFMDYTKFSLFYSLVK